MSKKKCFSIMPFDSSFNDVSDIIHKAAANCGMEYMRGDSVVQPGVILTKIWNSIRDADVIVADISDRNPNVFYELSYAHQIKPEKVVIITRDTDNSPYDVHQYDQLLYEHDKKGRKKLLPKLTEVLKTALNASSDEESWSVIRTRLQRTKRIVTDLRGLIGKGKAANFSKADIPKIDKDFVIRSISGLGSLAISDHEPPDVSNDPEYDKYLRLERDTLKKAILKGAKFKCLLNPPRVFTEGMGKERLKARYSRLIGLLNGKSDMADSAHAQSDLKIMKKCEWALNPISMPNILIIGNLVAYEGFKRGGGRGFERTHYETNPEAIQQLIEDFDILFNQCNSSDLAGTLQSFLNDALRGTKK